MTSLSALDIKAFTGALLLTGAIALSVAWIYGLDLHVLAKFGLFYTGLFAMAVGVPSYYVLRYINGQKLSE